MQNPFKKAHLKQFALITAMGLAISIAICTECFLSWENFVLRWKTIVICMVYTYILGYGCTFIVGKLEHKYSWLHEPRKKFFLQFFSLAAFSFITSAALFYVFAYFLFEGEKWITFGEVINQAKLPAFISVSISAFFTGSSFLENWKTEAVRAERLEREKIATQYESLRNQVNPHFLFNSLNALSELVYEDQELAVNYIRQLGQVYRYVLDSRNREVVSLREELEFLDSFIFLQKIRFGENLQVNVQLERKETEYLLPLSSQILLENAIKHNVVSKENPLAIDLYQEDGYLVVKHIINRKRTMDSGTGIGLENIKMRYSYLTELPTKYGEQQGNFVVKIPILKEEK